MSRKPYDYSTRSGVKPVSREEFHGLCKALATAVSAFDPRLSFRSDGADSTLTPSCRISPGGALTGTHFRKTEGRCGVSENAMDGRAAAHREGSTRAGEISGSGETITLPMRRLVVVPLAGPETLSPSPNLRGTT